MSTMTETEWRERLAGVPDVEAAIRASKEATWQKFESVLARRERIRLLIKGRVKTNSLPNVLVRNNEGKWVFPSLAQSG